MTPISVRAWHMPFGEKGPMQEMMYGSASSILAFAEMTPDKYIVEQFTGLKDITGLRVYVGDIIKVQGHPFEGSIQIDGNYEVWFDQSSLMYVAGSWRLSELRPYVTAIGNVHENPELLEQSKKSDGD